MMARPIERHAASAPWAFRLALLPLPLLLLAALLRRYHMIELTPLFLVMAIAWLLAALALVAAVAAFRSIWWEGSQGFRLALGGAVLAALVLALPATIVVEMIRLPRLFDISTDQVDPPLFTAAPDSVTMRPLPGAAEKAEQLEAYPDIVPRHYDLSPERVFRSIEELVAARDWNVTDQRAPDSDNEVGWVEAEGATFLFALPVDVAIRIIQDDTGTLVDMRSASRLGAHDLGDNAERIRQFFADLDTSLQGVTEANDGAGAAADNDADLPPLPEPPPASGR